MKIEIEYFSPKLKKETYEGVINFNSQRIEEVGTKFYICTRKEPKILCVKGQYLIKVTEEKHSITSIITDDSIFYVESHWRFL